MSRSLSSGKRPVRPPFGERDETREQAVALRYNESDELPRLVASGAGEIARRIVQIAIDHDIPIHEDASLAKMLSSLKPGATISEESFRIVAELISFLYHADLEWRKRHGHLDGLLAGRGAEGTKAPAAGRG